MREIYLTSALVALSASGAMAGGIDRSGQGLGALFETGRYFELSFGSVTPSVDGTDLLGGPTGSVGNDYSQIALSYKYDINDRVSFALNLDQPFGADVLYAPTSLLLGGTKAEASATSLAAILRYKFDGGFSVHGGVRADKGDGFIGLGGLAYGPVNGYNVTLDSDIAPGYLVGIAYEKPEIALRVALTYNSAIKHEFDTTERMGNVQVAPTSVTEVELPQSVNLDFQSGVAKDTLVFGQIRWADWSAFRVDPVWFTGATGGGLIDLEDTTTYTLGVGRKFNDNWAGSISFSYEDGGSDRLVSPLAPTNGKMGVTLGAVYTRDNMKLTMGVNYTKLGDAYAEVGTPDTAVADMRDNTAVGVGIKVGWSF
ncbi:OmpP1/FadL family transporter [Neotabrizicola sp. sgz301269]|uniref:OmpP1/FadL family transporter n=1 Tax=Neotabrizicola sp. sgz301269 TaxID=3276282 RepID=UPI0037701165